jgi:hypothetical protein
MTAAKPLACYGAVKGALRERLAIEMLHHRWDMTRMPYNLRHIRTVMSSDCEALLNFFCGLINLNTTNGVSFYYWKAVQNN